MRITFVTPELTLSGGMLAIVGFANGLADRGYSVTLVSLRSRFDSLVELIDHRVAIVWTRLRLRPVPGHHLTNAMLALDLARVIPRSDVLVATYAPTALPVLLASALGRGQRYWMYADYREMFSSRPVEWWMVRNLPRFFRVVMTNSHASVAELKMYSNVDAVFVGLGLPRRDHLWPPARSQARPLVALYVGDSRPRKGLREFLRAGEIAHQSISQLRLQIVTKDDAAISCQVPFDHVVKPSARALADLYRGCGVFVSTSWSESLGIPPLEAMACGAPVVITDQRGARDYAVDGKNCLVVPTRDPKTTAEAIIRILTDQCLAERLSAAGLETAQQYRWETALDRFESALHTAPVENQC